MEKSICFITTGDIMFLATMKRALGMAQPLIALGWRVDIIALSSENNFNRIALEAPDANIHWFKRGNFLTELLYKNYLIRKIKPRIVYVCALGNRNLVFPQKSSKIIVEHSELGSEIKSKSSLRRFQYRFYECYSLHYDGLVCASRFLEKYFHFYRKKKNKDFSILYSPYAYNEKILFLEKKRLAQLKRAYVGKAVFLYMGSLVKDYGLFTMLDAVYYLKDCSNNFKLILMGEGSDVHEAKEYIKKKGLSSYIDFPGYVDEADLSSYFELADAFISPLNDTTQDIARCPSKIYMYMPFEKPIFTSKIGEPYQIFKEKGFYFSSNNPKSLAELMIKFLEGSLQSRKFNIKEHSWHARAEDFNDWVIRHFLEKN